MFDNGLRLVCELELVDNVGGTTAIFVSKFEHFFCTHGFFFFPGPPNLGLSKQNLQCPQSLARQPTQSPHLLRLFPKLREVMVHVGSTNGYWLSLLTSHYSVFGTWCMVVSRLLAI